jgi:ribonuclease P protein component
MPKKLVFLQSDEDFDQFRRSKLFSSAALKLRVRFNANQNTPRFGFIIPKKVLAKVTDRNKIKRRMKSLIHSNIGMIKPADFLFFPGKPALKKTYAELEKETINLLAQARLWKA